MKVTRTLNEMQADITIHEAAIKKIKDEIKVFQSECPHPKNFAKEKSSSSKDEYGRLDGYYKSTTCLLCGHSEHWHEENRGY